MKYKITRVVTENRITKCDAVYWMAQDKKGTTIAIARLEGGDKCCTVLDIKCKDKKPSIEPLQLLLNEVLTFAKSGIKRIDIQILDNMKEIKKVLENNDFKEIFSSEYTNDINAVRYCKMFD